MDTATTTNQWAWVKELPEVGTPITSAAARLQNRLNEIQRLEAEYREASEVFMAELRAEWDWEDIAKARGC